MPPSRQPTVFTQGLTPRAVPSTSPGRPPKGEIGAIGNFTTGGVAPWTAFSAGQFEDVPDLIWPSSVRTYSAMRSDAQINALHLGTTLPIRRYKWYIKPNGSDTEIVDGVAADLNLPIQGDAEDLDVSRGRDKFSHDRHLYHVLLALIYGHYFFEQVGYIGDDGLWHLKKLAPRPPSTISQIGVADDGGLVFIQQSVVRFGMTAPEIPVDRLVAFVWDMEGGNWVGRSQLRSIYRDWLIKDRLLRINAINHERAGGIPYVNAPPGASEENMRELSEYAQLFRVGEDAGGALPHDATLNFASPSGGDAVESIKMHNEEMARSYLMMFMQLGQTQTGSYALGQSLIDWFSLQQQAIAKWYAEIMNQHMIEDWVDWNYGEGVEQVPQLCYEAADDPASVIGPLVALIGAGAITVDSELEANLRDALDLPEKPEEPPPEEIPVEPTPTDNPPSYSPGSGEVPPVPLPGTSPPVNRQTERVTAAAREIAIVPLPGRPLRRQPYSQEVRAKVDYSALETDWITARDKLVRQWQKIRRGQVNELVDIIAQTNPTNVEKLASIEIKPGEGTAVIEKVMHEVLGLGAAGALQEAAAQGQSPQLPNLDHAKQNLSDRAAAVDALLSRDISSAASRKAVSLAGQALSADDIANEVKTYLNGLTDTYLSEQFGGAVQAAQNTGRREVFDTHDPTQIYSSELLDVNTCANCMAVDGTVYNSLAAAELDYPTGGYKDCLGGVRCRGSLIAVYGEESPQAAYDPSQKRDPHSGRWISANDVPPGKYTLPSGREIDITHVEPSGKMFHAHTTDEKRVPLLKLDELRPVEEGPARKVSDYKVGQKVTVKDGSYERSGEVVKLGSKKVHVRYRTSRDIERTKAFDPEQIVTRRA